MVESSVRERVPVETPNGRARAQGPRRRRPQPPTIGGLFAVVLATVVWVVHTGPLFDNSFLWHLRTGHWILDHGIPRSDLYSFTVPEHPWVVQSWLAEVLYAGVDRLAGTAGLQMLRGALCVTITILVVRLAIRLTRDPVRGAALGTAAVMSTLLLWNERPLLLGALAMLSLVWMVEAPESRLGRRPLVALPVLFWLWANVHGSFALGFGYLVVHLIGQRLDGSSLSAGRERSLLQGGGLALLACAVNPLGFDLLTFPIHMLTLGGTLGSVVEWQSPSLQSGKGLLYAGWAALTVVALARGAAGTRASRRDVLVSLVFLGLGFWALRNIVIAPLVCLPVVCRSYRREGDRPVERRPVIHWAGVGVMVLVAGMAAGRVGGSDAYAPVDMYPVEAMGVVEAEGLLGSRLATTDWWSGYVIHAYWPRQRVFIDDRFDMYPTALLDDYLLLSRGQPGWQEVLDGHQLDVVVWPVDKPLAALLDGDEGWRRIHRDGVAGVWVRA